MLIRKNKFSNFVFFYIKNIAKKKIPIISNICFRISNFRDKYNDYRYPR